MNKHMNRITATTLAALCGGLVGLSGCSSYDDRTSTYSSNGQGWRDSEGVWHEGPEASGYRDSQGNWHNNMATSGAWRDSQGNWRTDPNPAGGWRDSQGNWHENSSYGATGWRDSQGVWHEGNQPYRTTGTTTNETSTTYQPMSSNNPPKVFEREGWRSGANQANSTVAGSSMDSSTTYSQHEQYAGASTGWRDSQGVWHNTAPNTAYQIRDNQRTAQGDSSSQSGTNNDANRTTVTTSSDTTTKYQPMSPNDPPKLFEREGWTSGANRTNPAAAGTSMDSSTTSSQVTGWRDSQGVWHEGYVTTVYGSHDSPDEGRNSTSSGQSGWESGANQSDTRGAGTSMDSSTANSSASKAMRHDMQAVNTADIPSNVNATIQAEAMGNSITRTSKFQMAGRTIYESETTMKGATYKILVDSDGSLLAKKRADWMSGTLGGDLAADGTGR